MSSSDYYNYKDPDYDYEKFTKKQLISIMIDYNVQEIPLLREKKEVILEAYKREIYDKYVNINKTYLSRSISNSIKHSVTAESVNEEPKISLGSDSSQISESASQESGQERFEYKNGSHIAGNVKTIEQDIRVSATDNLKSQNIIENLSFSSRYAVGVFNKAGVNPLKEELVPNKSVYPENFPHRKKSLNADKKSIHSDFSTSCTRAILYVFITVSVGFVILSKFVVPYCENCEQIICFNPPANSHLEDGLLVCDGGFYYERNYLLPDKCVKMTADPYMSKVAKFLGERRYSYDLGLVCSAFASKDEIDVLFCDCDDYESSILISNMRESSDYTENEKGEFTTALPVVSFKIYLASLRKLIFRELGIPAILCLFIFKAVSYWYSSSKRRKIVLQRSREIQKDLMELLMEQQGSTTEGIPRQQIVDYYQHVDPRVMIHVFTCLEKNSNILFHKKCTDGKVDVYVSWCGPNFMNCTHS